MEESEKRRERLKAMRLEADQAIASSGAGNSLGVSPCLTNPLIESSGSQSMQSNSYAAPRFDYYTDPMSAFNANKRSSKVSHQVPQDYNSPPRPRNDMTPPPAYGANTHSSDQRVFQAQGVYHSAPLGSPMQRAGPFGTPQVNSPGVFCGSNACLPDQRTFQAQGVYQNSSPYGSPMQTASPFGTPHMNSPGVIGGSTGPSSYFPSNLSRGGSSPSPSFAQHGGNPSFGQGRGQRFYNSSGPVSGRGGSPYPNAGRGSPYPNAGRGSPYSNTGRGRSHHSISPGSYQRGRGRSGSHNSISAEFRPDLFYNRSMVEDPWQQLKPVIWWNPGSSKSWLPKSIQMKKPRVEEDSTKPTSEPSLAEYLAASFNEAADSADADS